MMYKIIMNKMQQLQMGNMAHFNNEKKKNDLS